MSAEGKRTAPGAPEGAGNESTSPRALCSAGTRSGSTPARRSASAVAGPTAATSARAERPGVAQLGHETVDRVDRGEHHPVDVAHAGRGGAECGAAVGRIDLPGQRQLDRARAGSLERAQQPLGPATRTGDDHRAPGEGSRAGTTGGVLAAGASERGHRPDHDHRRWPEVHLAQARQRRADHALRRGGAAGDHRHRRLGRTAGPRPARPRWRPGSSCP